MRFEQIQICSNYSTYSTNSIMKSIWINSRLRQIKDKQGQAKFHQHWRQRGEHFMLENERMKTFINYSNCTRRSKDFKEHSACQSNIWKQLSSLYCSWGFHLGVRQCIKYWHLIFVTKPIVLNEMVCLIYNSISKTLTKRAIGIKIIPVWMIKFLSTA